MKDEKGPYAVATFHSTHSVLKAEKLLKEAGIQSVRLVPVPSQISSDCGVTVRFPLADAARARKVLDILDDDLEGYYGGDAGAWEPLSF